MTLLPFGSFFQILYNRWAQHHPRGSLRFSNTSLLLPNQWCLKREGEGIGVAGSTGMFCLSLLVHSHIGWQTFQSWERFLVLIKFFMLDNLSSVLAAGLLVWLNRLVAKACNTRMSPVEVHLFNYYLLWLKREFDLLLYTFWTWKCITFCAWKCIKKLYNHCC